jgi:hypothetical protein
MNYFVHTNSFSMSGVDAMPCLPRPAGDNAIRAVREQVTILPIYEKITNICPPCQGYPGHIVLVIWIDSDIEKQEALFSKEGSLSGAADTHFSHSDCLPAGQCTGQKRCIRVVGREVLRHNPLADIGITVPATMRTGIVGTDVNAGNATATRPLTAVFFNADRMPQDQSQYSVVNTSCLLNPTLLVEKAVAAGVELHPIFIGNNRKLGNKPHLFRFLDMQQFNTLHIPFALLVQAQKTYRASAGETV